MILKIPNFDEDYRADNTGNIYSFRFNKIKKLKQCNNLKGYKIVKLCQNKKPKTYLVSRLIAKTFLKNYSEELEVNHIDGNKENNNINNLEMCTHKENVQHAFNLGLKNGIHLRGINNPNNKLTVEEVAQIRDLSRKKIFSQREIAKLYGIHQSSVSLILNQLNWSYL